MVEDLAQDVGEDAAVAVVFDFDGGVDAAGDGDVLLAAVGTGDAEGEGLARLEVVVQADEAVGLGAVEAEGLGGGAFLEAAGEDAHANEVAAVDAFEAFGDDGAHAQQARAFGGPVAAGAGAVFLAGDDDEGDSRLLVGDGGVVDGFDGAGRAAVATGGVAFGDAAFNAGDHEVFDADVGEGATGHDAVVASAGAVGVEVGFLDAVFEEVFACGGVGFDGAGGGDVVGGDAVAEDAEGAGVFYGGNVAGLEGEVFEEGGVLDVGGVFAPSVGLAGGGGDVVPFRVLCGEVGVEGAEDFGLEGEGHLLADFFLGGPDVAKVDGLAVFVGAEGFGGEVDIYSAGEGVGDDEGRGHEEVGFDGGVDAGFEVAVAGEDAGGDEVVGDDGVFDGGVEGAGVADAGGAAVADEVEAELVEVGLEAGFLEVVSDDAGAGGEGGFDVGGFGEAAFDGFFGEEAGTEHDGGVGGVGAGGDGGDENGGVVDLAVVAG